MSLRCYFQYDDGRFCKNWAMKGTRFCNNHQPPDASQAVVDPVPAAGLPPVPLKSLADLFQLVGEALIGLRTGAMSPGRAYATSCLGKLWLELHGKMKAEAKRDAFMREWQTAVAKALGQPAPPDPAPDPEPPPAAVAAPVAPTPPHNPRAAGRLAGPVPANEPGAAPGLDPPALVGPVNSDPLETISLEQARASLTELLGWKPDTCDEPVDPALPRRPTQPATGAADPPRPASSARAAKHNGSPASHVETNTRDPAAQCAVSQIGDTWSFPS